jgi:hypothetical protein
LLPSGLQGIGKGLDKAGNGRLSRRQEPGEGNYYSKAIELASNSKAIEADPKLVEKQEEWVRERLKSGKSADLLERIDVKLRGKDSLPDRKDLIEKHCKELIIRALFLEKLIADELNDAKLYRKGIEIKNAVVIGDLDLSKAEIAPSITISSCIFLGKVDLNNSWFQRGLNLDGSHFLGAADFEFLKVGKSAGFRAPLFRGPVIFRRADIESVFSATGDRFEGTFGPRLPRCVRVRSRQFWLTKGRSVKYAQK